MTVLFEVFPRAAMNLVIFGAGHVASSLVDIVSGLDMHVTWVDSRAELFPVTCAPSIKPVVMENPVEYLEQIEPDAYVVIITHDHTLDYALTRALLDEGNFQFLGLIGSETKAARFKKRLKHLIFVMVFPKMRTCNIMCIMHESSAKHPRSQDSSVVKESLSP